jgi:hypothetical protein
MIQRKKHVATIAETKKKTCSHLTWPFLLRYITLAFWLLRNAIPLYNILVGQASLTAYGLAAPTRSSPFPRSRSRRSMPPTYVIFLILLVGAVASQPTLLHLNADENSKLGSWPRTIIPHGDNEFIVELRPPKIVEGGFTRGIYLVNALTGNAKLLPGLQDHELLVPPNYKSDIQHMGAHCNTTGFAIFIFVSRRWQFLNLFFAPVQRLMAHSRHSLLFETWQSTMQTQEVLGSSQSGCVVPSPANLFFCDYFFFYFFVIFFEDWPKFLWMVQWEFSLARYFGLSECGCLEFACSCRWTMAVAHLHNCS